MKRSDLWRRAASRRLVRLELCISPSMIGMPSGWQYWVSPWLVVWSFISFCRVRRENSGAEPLVKSHIIGKARRNFRHSSRNTLSIFSSLKVASLRVLRVNQSKPLCLELQAMETSVSYIIDSAVAGSGWWASLRDRHANFAPGRPSERFAF